MYNLSRYYSWKALSWLVIILTLWGCSTEKNTLLHRTYHNVTARYNGYFHAKESFKGAVEKVENGYDDDYSRLLPVFIYPDENSASSIYPQMDRAVEKCSKVIHRHSMYIKRKEYCKWIDDCYLLIGKAQFYKRDFNEAIKTLEYVAKEYKPEDYPKNDIRSYALLWLAKAYMEKNRFSKANNTLNLIKGEPNFPEKLRSEVEATEADYYIRKKQYANAVNELSNAISSAKDRDDKIRYTFILAQLYHEMGNSRLASDYYGDVIGLSPPYEMAFYAKINRAMAFDVNSGNSTEIKEELKKMLKDDKNIEYFDQIYFALAEIAFKEGKTEQGIEYLKLSTSSGTSDPQQKSRAFLKLADIYFGRENYPLAQAYYDSTVKVMDKTVPGFENLLNTRNSLTRLVRDIKIVEREDSLQALAAMSETEREVIVEGIIEEVIQKEEEKRIEQEYQQELRQRQQQSKFNQVGRSGGEWYFYNPTSVSRGKEEFQSVWGKRSLEDNWRRKNKSSSQFSADMSGLLEADVLPGQDTNATARDLKSKQFYLKNIPLSKSDMKQSHDRIIGALYDKGIIYKEELENNEMAIKTFEDLISRYDTSRYHLVSYYQLYRLYNVEGNAAKSGHYKNIILNQYPDSDYAKLIRDPEYFEKQAEKENEINKYYQETYRYYKRGYYSRVMKNSSMSDSLFPDNELESKFAYLYAQAKGAMIDNDSIYKKELLSVIEKYPDSEEAKVAQRTIEYMEKQKREKELEEKRKEAEENGEQQNKTEYVFSPGSKHTFVLIISSDKNINQFKAAISNFNSQFFRLEQLKISNVFLDADRQMISVKDFEDENKAMEYYRAFKQNFNKLKAMKEEDYALFAISFANFAKFYQKKDIEEYKTFFELYY